MRDSKLPPTWTPKEIPAYEAQNFLFQNSRLIPIEDPVAEELLGEADAGDFTHLGFSEFNNHPDYFGIDGCWSLSIHGPAFNGPFRYACEICINGNYTLIWFRDFPSLHEYLIAITPVANLFRHAMDGNPELTAKLDALITSQAKPGSTP